MHECMSPSELPWIASRYPPSTNGGLQERRRYRTSVHAHAPLL